MPQFRKKPVVIEARQFTGRNGNELLVWMQGYELSEDFPGTYIEIKTLEGTMRADAGDWVIKGVKGEFYPCKPAIFEATYTPAEETAWLVIQGYFDVDGQSASYSSAHGPFETEKEANDDMHAREAIADQFDVFAVIQMAPCVDALKPQA